MDCRNVFLSCSAFRTSSCKARIFIELNSFFDVTSDCCSSIILVVIEFNVLVNLAICSLLPIFLPSDDEVEPPRMIPEAEKISPFRVIKLKSL